MAEVPEDGWKKKTRRDAKDSTIILHLVYFFLAAFSADFVTAVRKTVRNMRLSGANSLTLASALLGLVDGLDDSDGNGPASCHGRRNDREEGTRCKTQRTI